MTEKLRPIFWETSKKIVEAIRWAAENPDKVLTLNDSEISDIEQEWHDYLVEVVAVDSWIPLSEETPEPQTLILLKIVDKLTPSISYTETCYLEYDVWYTTLDESLDLEPGFVPVAWMNIPN